MRLVLAFVFVLIFSSLTFADFNQTTKSEKIILNPKQVSEATFRIVQSGALHVNGDVSTMNLTLTMPQEGVLNVSVAADSWKYSIDEFGNKVLVLEWKKPVDTVNYRAEVTVNNEAKMLAQEKNISHDSSYLKENDQIKFTPEIGKIAYPFEKTVKKAAELAIWVHNYVNYDLSLVSQLKPSDWVYENRRGVCVEYANLLSSLLKMSGIPTRYVVGYAYSAVEDKLIGHTWVEILAEDGWIPLDPTWNQAGYLDATHIKTAVRQDANVTEKLLYSGFGNIDVKWAKNDNEIAVLDYRLKNLTRLSLSADDIGFNEHGVIRGLAETASCTIEAISISSCSGERGDLLNIFESERTFWLCGKARLYWPFNATDLDRKFVYTCPVSLYDQTGSRGQTNIEIKETKAVSSIEIEGPDTVGINEPYTLTAMADKPFTFFSPTAGESKEKSWDLMLARGQHNFYLVSDSALAKKTVAVVEQKEFSVTASAQKNVSLNGSFLLSVIAENLLDEEKTARIRIDFDGNVIEKEVLFPPGGTKSTDFNITAAKTGARKISVSALADTISSYSTSIFVYAEKPLSVVDSILGAIIGFFSAIASFIASLLPM